MARSRVSLISAAIMTARRTPSGSGRGWGGFYPRPTREDQHLSSPPSPADNTDPTDTRRGRAWIDQAAGIRIGYTLAGISPGTSKTVLLILGAPQTGYAWRKVVPRLVAAGYQVVVPDYRGAGASTKPLMATTNGPWPATFTTSSTTSHSSLGPLSTWSALSTGVTLSRRPARAAEWDRSDQNRCRYPRSELLGWLAGGPAESTGGAGNGPVGLTMGQSVIRRLCARNAAVTDESLCRASQAGSGPRRRPPRPHGAAIGRNGRGPTARRWPEADRRRPRRPSRAGPQPGSARSPDRSPPRSAACPWCAAVPRSPAPRRTAAPGPPRCCRDARWRTSAGSAGPWQDVDRRDTAGGERGQHTAHLGRGGWPPARHVLQCAPRSAGPYSRTGASRLPLLPHRGRRRAGRTSCSTSGRVAFLDGRPVFPGHTLLVPPGTTRDAARTARRPRSRRSSGGPADGGRHARGLGAQGTFVAMNNVVSQSVPTCTCTSYRGPRGTGCAASSGPAEVPVGRSGGV